MSLHPADHPFNNVSKKMRLLDPLTECTEYCTTKLHNAHWKSVVTTVTIFTSQTGKVPLSVE